MPMGDCAKCCPAHRSQLTMNPFLAALGHASLDACMSMAARSIRATCGCFASSAMMAAITGVNASATICRSMLRRSITPSALRLWCALCHLARRVDLFKHVCDLSGLERVVLRRLVQRCLFCSLASLRCERCQHGRDLLDDLHRWSPRLTLFGTVPWVAWLQTVRVLC